MKVLLTGAYGNIGCSALDALLERGHLVRAFDLPTPQNQRSARRYQSRIEAVWGDLRRPDEVAAAVAEQDVVVHLGFIIPKLSITGMESESHPDLAWAVNVGGTHNLLDAMRAQPVRPRIVFASSYHVYGPPTGRDALRTAQDPVNPIEHYARHKVACEWLIKASGLEWTILRFAATLPLSLRLDPYMFQIPLDNRMEFTHTLDVGVAVANAVSSDQVWGRTLLIGGGDRCQLYYGEIVRQVLDATGVGMLPAQAFGRQPFATDWVDSSEAESILHYQSRTLQDYAHEMAGLMGIRRHLLRLVRPIVRYSLLRRSPYWRQAVRRPARWAQAVTALLG
ncbi:MAG: NAD-dependent epimerase/dehydratase family protein [Anaerolineae bacterium]